MSSNTAITFGSRPPPPPSSAGLYGSVELSLEYISEERILSVTVHSCRVSTYPAQFTLHAYNLA